MREETRPIRICLVCKLPILPEQRPSVELENGEEIHCECWAKYNETRDEN